MLRRPALNMTAIVAAGLIVACGVVVGAICLDRQYLNVDTETDFVVSFLPEAERLARGQPLLIQYHPPGYAVMLALVNGVVDDWMKTGLLVAWLSTVCVLLASYELFRRVGGDWAAVGALGGLAVSDLFLAYGAQATSDVPFLALWTTALALTAAALDVGGRGRWVAVGVVAGIGMLTRTNGILLVLLVLAPLLTTREWGSRAAESASAATGLAVPICAWASFASFTGTPVVPTGNHANLALAYFGEGFLSSDTLHLMNDRFSSSWQVLAHDPLHIFTTYLKDLAGLPRRILMQTTSLPVGALGAAVFPLWVFKIKEPKVAVVLGTALASVLLTNLHPFEARLYLLLVPLLGASIGYAVSLWLDRPSRLRFAPTAAMAGLAIAAVAGLLQAAPRAHTRAEAPAIRAQLTEAVPAIRRYTPPEAILVARKDNLAFHAQRRTALLPSVTTIRALCGPVQTQLKSGPVYIYIGWAERQRHRAELARQLLGGELPAWLEVAAQGSAGGGWRLFAVKHAACGEG